MSANKRDAYLTFKIKIFILVNILKQPRF